MTRCSPSLWIRPVRTSRREPVRRVGGALPSLLSAFTNPPLLRSLLKGSCKEFAQSGTTSGARARNGSPGHRLTRRLVQVGTSSLALRFPHEGRERANVFDQIH